MDTEGKMKNINEKVEEMRIRYIDMPLDVIGAYFKMYKEAFVSELEYELFNELKNECNMTAVEAEKTVKDISEGIEDSKKEAVLKKEYNNIEEILSLVKDCIINCKKCMGEDCNQQVKEKSSRIGNIKNRLHHSIEEKYDDDCYISRRYVERPKREITRKYFERLQKDISKIYRLIESDEAVKRIFKPINSQFDFRHKSDIEIYIKRLKDIKNELKLLPGKFAFIEGYKQSIVCILKHYENKFNDIVSNANSSSKNEWKNQESLENKDEEENYYDSLSSYIFTTPEKSSEENQQDENIKGEM